MKRSHSHLLTVAKRSAQCFGSSHVGLHRKIRNEFTHVVINLRVRVALNESQHSFVASGKRSVVERRAAALQSGRNPVVNEEAGHTRRFCFALTQNAVVCGSAKRARTFPCSSKSQGALFFSLSAPKMMTICSAA